MTIKNKNKAIRTNHGIKEYTYLGCPLTRNRSAWCFRICVPDAKGQGHCGRVAPHGLKGRTQLAIEGQNRKQRRIHLEKLELMYLAAPCNECLDPGISISEGETDIVLPLRTELVDAAGRVPDSVCIKAMNDAALCAVSSLVRGEIALTVSFNASLSGAVPSGGLLVRGRFVGMSGSHYLAESILADSEGKEIGRGDGRFVAQ
jgi:acyl-coenzyme A thioesterase PaaI-like protein